MHLGEKEKH